MSALAVLPVLSPATAFPLVPRSHVDVVSGAAAACSFIGELFMLKALLVYDSPESRSKTSKSWLLASPQAAAALVIVMGLLASITGGLLLMSIEYMPDIPSRVLYCCLSLSCLLIGSSSTYGLGGFMLHHGKARPSDPTSQASRWQFFQPFAGGTAFVATQAVGWSLFSATIVGVIVLLQRLVAGVAHCVRCWAMSVGVLMILAQLTLGISVLTYQHAQSAKRLLHHPSTALCALQRLLGRHLPVLLMYLPVHTFFLAWTLSFTFLPLQAAMTVWVALLVPYYTITSRGNPGHTGCRRWDWLCRWFERNVEESLTLYFGELRVIRDTTPLPPRAPPTPADPRSSPAPAAAAAPTPADPTAADRSAADMKPPTSAVLRPTSRPLESSPPSDPSALSEASSSEPPLEPFNPSLPTYPSSPPPTATSEASSSDPSPLPVDPTLLPSDPLAASSTDSRSSDPSPLPTDSTPPADLTLPPLDPLSQSDSCSSDPTLDPGDPSTPDPPSKYIFAFHPHGYYPTGAGFLPMMPSFRKLFPGVTPCTLTASVMYLAPAIKDICCWAGFRQVTRRTFVKALQDAGAVVMCPGGQAEMVHSWRAFRKVDPELVLHVRHKGFCRIAIEEQAAVVPVLALGESLQLRNAVDAPSIQQYTYRRLGFPFPYLMTGRWGVTPIPRKVPLHYVVGDPIPPPPHPPAGGSLDPAVLDEYHGRYVEALRGLFERHKDAHPVLKHARLVLATD